MHYFWLYVFAPFATFREFQAGSFIGTAPVMPPSAAYGLLLNLAGIEMSDRGTGSTSSVRTFCLPALHLAVGLLSKPTKASVLQQLHSYPIGNNAQTKKLAQKTRGAKYLISPVRREFLVGYEGMIGVGSEDESLELQIHQSLCGKSAIPRYGLPFAGDSNFLFDRIEILSAPPVQTVWYSRITRVQNGSTRLTAKTDFADSSKTVYRLYAPMEYGTELPEEIWTLVSY